MRDFLAFRRMIATYFIQIIFWIGLIAIVVAFFGAISQDQALLGFLILIFGALYWRILCEVFIVFFRMNDTLTSIKRDTAAIPPALAGRGGTSDAGGGGAHTEEPAPFVEPTETVTRDMPPQGWYDDAERPGHQRWWDGTAWGIRDDEHPSVTEAAAEPGSEAAPAAASSSGPEPASAPQSPVRYCENCGAVRSPGGRFCTSCGHA